MPSRGSARRSPSGATTSCRARARRRCSRRTASQSSWQSPEQVGSADSEMSIGRRVDQVDSVDARHVDAVELPPVAEESVPFFKREISFRRKKKDAGEEVAAEETPDDVVDESVDESFATHRAAATDEVTDATRRVGASGGRGRCGRGRARGARGRRGGARGRRRGSERLSPPSRTFAPSFEADTSPPTSSRTTDDAEKPVVPFYKREISFRRKKNVAEVAAAAEVVARGRRRGHERQPAEASRPRSSAPTSRPRSSLQSTSRRRPTPSTEEPNVGEEATVRRGRRSRRVRRRRAAGRADDAPALEIVPVHELDQPGTDDEALEESALSRHHGAPVAHRGRHARARRIRASTMWPHSSPRLSRTSPRPRTSDDEAASARRRRGRGRHRRGSFPISRSS